MRYMLLIYSREQPGGVPPEERPGLYQRHAAVMEDARRKGAFTAAGEALVTDGPFAETKEQLAGYYMLECANLDEAIEWAARIPTGCKGAEGCIEIRPLPGLPARPPEVQHAAGTQNGGNG